MDMIFTLLAIVTLFSFSPTEDVYAIKGSSEGTYMSDSSDEDALFDADTDSDDARIVASYRSQ